MADKLTFFEAPRNKKTIKVLAIGNSFSGDATAYIKDMALADNVDLSVAYALYFGAIKNIKASAAAILSYIDPVFAIVLSSAISLTLPDKWVLIGGVMILGSTLISEIKFDKKKE